MAVLKKIKFGSGAATLIAQTVVTKASESVLSVTGTNTGENDDANPSYEIDLNISNDGTLVKDTSSAQAVLKVGTVPAAQVSVAAGGHDAEAAEPDGKIFVGDDVEDVLTELNTKISQTVGAAKSYKIIEAASPASTSLKEYKVQVAIGDGAFADDTNSATIVVPKDQHLKSVVLVNQRPAEEGESGPVSGNFLKFTYVLNDGTESDVYVDVSAFLTESEFGDGLEVSNAGVVSAKLGNGIEFGNEATGNKSLNVKIDSTSETDGQATPAAFLTVGGDGVKVQGIKAEITRQIQALDNTSDTAVAGQYITYITEADGIVSAGDRANVSEAVLNNYAKGSAPTAGSEAVAATDTVNQAIAKLEHQVDAAKTAASAARSVVEQATSTGNEHVTVTASQPDATTGAITYTIGENDIASAQGLSDEITRAQNAEGEIAGLVGLDGTEGSRTFSPTTNYGGSSASVQANMQALDTQIKANADAIGAIQYSVSGTELTFYGMTAHA